MKELKDLLTDLFQGQRLDPRDVVLFLSTLRSDAIASEQKGALLGAFQASGVGAEQIFAIRKALLSQAVIVKDIPKNISTSLVDVCGTGGDGGRTFNISTAVAFVVAACGVPVAKHGNRAVSSQSGSSDVLEALGVSLATEPETVRKDLAEFGISFLFAPAFHPALKELAPLRKNVGVRTVFNVLGPLLNPAGVKRQIYGIYDLSMMEKIAKVLKLMKMDDAILLHSQDGMDEVSLCGKTNYLRVKNGKMKKGVFDPKDFGFKKVQIKNLQGGSATENAQLIEDIFSKKDSGPRAQVVLANASVALLLGGKARTLRDGVRLATDAIDSGRVMTLLKRMRGHA